MRRRVSFLLALSMILSTFSFVFANGNQIVDNGRGEDLKGNQVIEELGDKKFSKAYYDLLDQVGDKEISDQEQVGLIIELDDNYYSNYGRTLSPSQLQNSEGIRSQVEFAKKANADALAKIRTSYPEFELLYELEVLLVGFTGRAPFGIAKSIANEDYIKSVSIAIEFERPALPGPQITTYMDQSSKIVEANQVWGEFKGEGMVSAIIDSGFDASHPAFYLSDSTIPKLSKERTEKLIKDEGLRGFYISDKIPYAYNYADTNNIIKETDQKSHGQHVAGTVAANYITGLDGNEISGIAPEAQILAMRVFSDGAGTSEYTYIPAMDEAIKLGADSINMSLGAPSAATKDISTNMNEVIQRAADIGCVVAIAGGNEGQFGDSYKNPSTDNPDFGIVGTPAVASKGLAVASMENSHMRINPIRLYINDRLKFEAAHQKAGEVSFNSEKSFEYLEAGLGKGEDFEGKDFSGKYALIERGEINFSDKVLNAQKNSAIGVIVYNNEAGGEDLTGMVLEGDIKIPATFVARSTGLKLIENLDKGEILVSNDIAKTINPNDGIISSFSNWGLSADGEFKPEVLAPGSYIYSLMNDGGFTSMNGTSMATPHVAGGILLVRDRVNRDFPELEGDAVHSRVKNLIMSTAQPHINKNGVISSPRNQGAGIMKLYQATKSNTIVTNPSTGYSALALGDVDSTFSFDVRVENLGDKTVSYTYYTSVTTDETEGGYFTLNPRKLYDSEKRSLSIGPRSSEIITINIDISEYDAELLKDMRNGYFVEGFVIFESEDAVDLSYPFVGFRGSWEDLPVIEPSIYHLDREGKKPFYYEEGGTDYTAFFGRVGKSLILAGQSNYFDPDNSVLELPLAMSPNGDEKLDELMFYVTMLRNFEDFHMQVFRSDDQGNRGDLIYKTNSINGKKHHFSGGNGGRWGKSDFYASMNFKGRDAQFGGRPLEDGKYFLVSSVKAVGPASNKGGYRAQEVEYPVIIDTLAPEIRSPRLENQILSYELVEEGSGLMAEFAYYENDGVRIDLEKNQDGRFIVPEAIDHSAIQIELVDRALNSFKDNLENLLYEGSLGSLEISLDTGDSKLYPTVKYKVVKKEDPSIEMTNLGRLPIGDYILIIQEINGNFRLKSDKEIELTISEDNLDQEIVISLEEVIMKSITFARRDRLDIPNEDLEFYLVSLDNPGEEYKGERSEFLDYWYDFKIPHGVYRAEIRNLPAGYTADFSLDKDEIIIDSKSPGFNDFWIRETGDASIEISSIFEDGKDIKVEYIIRDRSDNTYNQDDKFGPGVYDIYPAAVPEGYYADKIGQSVTVTSDQNHYQVEFKYMLQGKGRIELSSSFEGEDFDAKFKAVSLNPDHEGNYLEYKDLDNLPFGHYEVLPIDGSFDFNYTFIERDNIVYISRERPVGKLDLKWERIDSSKKGTAVLSIKDETLMMNHFDLEITDYQGESKLYEYNALDFLSGFIDLPLGYYTFEIINLPEGYVSNPRIQKTFINEENKYFYVNFEIVKELTIPQGYGSLEVTAFDQDGKEIEEFSYGLVNSQDERVNDPSELEYGSYKLVAYNNDEYQLVGPGVYEFQIDENNSKKTIKLEYKIVEIPSAYIGQEIEIKSYGLDLDGLANVRAFDISDQARGLERNQSPYESRPSDKVGKELLVVMGDDYRFKVFGPEYAKVRLEYEYYSQDQAIEKTFEEITLSKEKKSININMGKKLDVISIFDDQSEIEVQYRAFYDVKSYGRAFGGVYTNMSNLPNLSGRAFKIEPISIPDGYKLVKSDPENALISFSPYVSNPKITFYYEKIEESRKASVKSIEKLDPITVKYGSSLDDISLPENVKVNIVNSQGEKEESNIPVIWETNGLGNFMEENKEIIIEGSLKLDGLDISNPDNLKAELIIKVGEKPEEPVNPEPEKPVDPEPEKPIKPEPGKPVEPEPEKPVKPEPGSPIIPGIGDNELRPEEPDKDPYPIPRPLPQPRPEIKDDRNIYENFLYNYSSDSNKNKNETIKDDKYLEIRENSLFRDFKLVDIDNSKYFTEIRDVVNRGLMNGIGEDMFDPSTSVNRAMIAQVLMNMTKDAVNTKKVSSFIDVDEKDWYFDAISWAQENGLVQGVGEDRFEPLREITREEFSTLMSRYIKRVGLKLEKTHEFNINSDILVSSWAVSDVKFIQEAGVLDIEGKYDGSSQVAREELAKALYVINNNYIKGKNKI